ncbi:MAG: hypothetical protein MI919_22950 [Holophagales bacterium]|nr:hypothetical protein [Holophagales bacterium]
MEVEGFAPLYFWEISSEAGSVLDLGDLELEEGASVVGWVDSPGFGLDEHRIELRPAMRGWKLGARERARLASTRIRAPISPRGFFRLSGLEAGAYELRLVGEGREPIEMVKLLRVEAGQELVLEEVFEIPPEVKAEIWIEPPLDVHGEPWRVSLVRQVPGARLLKVVKQAPAANDGTWAQGGLPQGEYSMEIEDSQGSTWHRSDLSLEAGGEPRLVEIELVEVRGEVSIGDDPLAATLVFGGRQRPRISMRSDAEGRFEGYLPREGDWIVHLQADGGWNRQVLESIPVERRNGKSYAELEIRLPDTRLRARVFRDGEPEAGALVIVRGYPESKRSVGSFTTDEAGRIDVRGVEPGSMAMMAHAGKAVSDWRILELAEESEHGEHRLELRLMTTLSGRVVHEGRGVPGARVLGVPSGERFLPWKGDTVSAIDGSFEIDVPADVPAVDLLVIPPGLGFVIHRAQLAGRDETSSIEIAVRPEHGRLDLYRLDPFDPYLVRFRGGELSLDVLRGALLDAGLAETDSRGALVLRNAAPGPYVFCRVPVESSEKDCASGVLSSYGSLALIAPRPPEREAEPATEAAGASP